jgi:release factor glutamine methyltransferase
LAVAQANAADHAVAERIEFATGDLFSGVPAACRFDFIVSNPPYVSHQELEQLPSGVKDHEPRQALDGGPDGTSVIARLVSAAGERLKPGGWLLCEISPMIRAPVEALLHETNQFHSIATINDLAQLPRVVIARRKAADQAG